MVVRSSSMPNRQPDALGIFGPRMDSTLVQPWIPTAASSSSMLTRKAKSSPTQSSSAIPTFPSRRHLLRTESSMAFRSLPVPSRVRRRPQASPRSTPLPTFETSLNHGDYSRLPPSSHLGSRCLVVQGCPHMTLQGWYRHHRQHRPTRLQITHRGAHRPAQQAPRCCHLLRTKHCFTLHPDALTLPAPLLQGWGMLRNGLRLVRRRLFPHENPWPIAPAPRRRHRLR